MLPPRCAGCGTIVDEVHSFCADCWLKVEFLGTAGCTTCGRPLEATDAERCGVCLAQPPLIARSRAAVAYDDMARGLAIRLKYGRKVALARTMARFMAPLADPMSSPESAMLVPVPLHRWRLWHRGFNQSALIAAALAAPAWDCDDNLLLERIKRTPPLKGLNERERRRDGRRRVPRHRPRSRARAADHPDRRRPDHRQHRRGLRQGAATRGRGES